LTLSAYPEVLRVTRKGNPWIAGHARRSCHRRWTDHGVPLAPAITGSPTAP